MFASLRAPCADRPRRASVIDMRAAFAWRRRRLLATGATPQFEQARGENSFDAHQIGTNADAYGGYSSGTFHETEEAMDISRTLHGVAGALALVLSLAAQAAQGAPRFRSVWVPLSINDAFQILVTTCRAVSGGSACAVARLHPASPVAAGAPWRGGGTHRAPGSDGRRVAARHVRFLPLLKWQIRNRIFLFSHLFKIQIRMAPLPPFSLPFFPA